MIPPGALYSCDNGKFGMGWPSEQAWFAWLTATVDRYGPELCVWAVAPDVPMDAADTLAESLPWLEPIRSLGIPAAFAAQDGSEHGLIPWDATDVLFLAERTEWKTSPAAHRLAVEAQERGLAVHMGRVNSHLRLRIAQACGCTSCDGTYLAFGPHTNPPPPPGLAERTPHHPHPVRRRRMTSRLRHIGAAIMGILDPIPSPVPSPMTEEEGAWVRAHAWTKGLRTIEDAYPHGFHRWCSCERGICTGCTSGHHNRCISAHGPRIDKHADTITDAHGFVVAVIQYGPGQRPCRWICPCPHPAAVAEIAATVSPEQATEVQGRFDALAALAANLYAKTLR